MVEVQDLDSIKSERPYQSNMLDSEGLENEYRALMNQRKLPQLQSISSLAEPKSDQQKVRDAMKLGAALSAMIEIYRKKR